jgi:hypothetical protein
MCIQYETKVNFGSHKLEIGARITRNRIEGSAGAGGVYRPAQSVTSNSDGPSLFN